MFLLTFLDPPISPILKGWKKTEIGECRKMISYKNQTEFVSVYRLFINAFIFTERIHMNLRILLCTPDYKTTFYRKRCDANRVWLFVMIRRLVNVPLSPLDLFVLDWEAVARDLVWIHPKGWFTGPTANSHPDILMLNRAALWKVL